MPVNPRLRRLTTAALPALAAVALTACNNAAYPNSIFHDHTEFNREVDGLWRILIILGTFVFIFVEALLLYAIFRYRRRSESDRPEHVHGNTTLEILWTAIPALILAFIAVPTVRTIFKTQAKARGDALQVEVIGHQWWWEFRYPQYKVTTAGELYLPIGRTVNFSLKTQDVLHSFWVPEFSQKQDAVPGTTTHVTVTPNKLGTFPIICTELCGLGHAVMRSTVIVMSKAGFEKWAKQGSQAGGGGGGGGGAAAGKAVFANNGCGACHTLKAAASTGTVGPDLDKLPDYAKQAGQPLDQFVRESIVKPDAYVEKGYPPNVMPPTFASLPKPQLDALVQFLVDSSKGAK